MKALNTYHAGTVSISIRVYNSVKSIVSDADMSGLN